MDAIFRRLATASLLSAAAIVAQGVAANNGSPDPAFTNIPFERWIAEGDQAHIHWNARVLGVELSNHQRFEARIEMVLDGNELARRRGKGYMAMLVEFTDSANRVYQTHQALDLQLVKEDAGKSNISYIQSAFVTPGDYTVSLAIFDTATGEHSALRLPLHVNPLKNDALPDSWRDLPPVEIIKPLEPPDDLFLPNITGRLRLQLETRRPVRVELLVNASPLSAGEPSRNEQVNNRSLASLIPALKVIAGTAFQNGKLNVELLDLTTQHVIFQQDSVRDLDWSKLGPALKQAGPNVIDIHALEHRQQNAQFFLAEVRRRLGVGARTEGEAQPLPVLIVLSGPMAFSSGEDLHPIELGEKPEAEVFYVRYHSIPPRPISNPFVDESRRARRGQYRPLAPASPPVMAEPVDSLEHTLKPLQPRLFDVYTPEQFRKALSSIIDEVSKLTVK